MQRRVLIIEDDHDISHLLEMHLADIDCESIVAHSGDTGLERYHQQQPDLIILDLMLPVVDGLSICREIRASQHYVPILMLTAKSSELDRVLGLEMGADDYLTKPFSIPELIARVKALFRRTDALSQQSTKKQERGSIEYNGIKIDSERHQVWIDEKQIELTAREFELLQFFARHPGSVYNRSQLLDAVWGYDHDGYEHTVNTHINRLRIKIEKDPANPKYVQTVWGVGYKFAE
jgi:two-component system, OmpR family, response regulator